MATVFHTLPAYSAVHVVAEIWGWDDAVAFGTSFPVPLQSKNSPPPAFSTHPPHAIRLQWPQEEKSTTW
jgi:hypothetical protein